MYVFSYVYTYICIITSIIVCASMYVCVFMSIIIFSIITHTASKQVWDVRNCNKCKSEEVQWYLYKLYFLTLDNRTNFQFKEGKEGLKVKKYANKLEIKKAWKQVKAEAHAVIIEQRNKQKVNSKAFAIPIVTAI